LADNHSLLRGDVPGVVTVRQGWIKPYCLPGVGSFVRIEVGLRYTLSPG
jgi:hypothetical protein